MARKYRSLLQGLVLASIVAAVAMGCSQSAPAPASAPAKPADAAAKPAEPTKAAAPAQAAPAQAASGQKIVVRLGDAVNEEDPQYKAQEHLVKRMAELTNGQVEIRLFPNSALGDQRSMLEAAQQGNMEIVKASNATVSGFAPRSQILDLPYLITSSDQAKKVFASQVVKENVYDDFEKAGLKVYTFFDPRARSVYNSKRPITKPEDMKGLKIRVMQSPAMIDTMNALGASGVPMAFGELYSAMQQGVVDGAENAPNYFWSQKHYEVAKFFSHTEQFRGPEELIFSLKWWNGLPKNVQDAFITAEKELWKVEVDARNTLLKEAEVGMEAKGVKVNKPDIEPFKALMKPVYDKYGSVVGGRDRIDAILNIK